VKKKMEVQSLLLSRLGGWRLPGVQRYDNKSMIFGGNVSYTFRAAAYLK